MSELSVKINLSGLSNKELAKEVSKINTAYASSVKSTWDIARAFATIKAKELYADDFDTDKNFCALAGVSPSYLTQCVKAVAFVEKHNVSTTVTKAYRLSTLTDEEYEDFTEWLYVEYQQTPFELSDHCLADSIKEWKETLVQAEEVEAEEVEAEEVEAETEVEEAEDVMVEVTDAEGNKYLVPLMVINQYRI